jgi:hypothetical protein
VHISAVVGREKHIMFTVLTILGGYLIFVGIVVVVGRAAARGGCVLEPLSRKDVLGPPSEGGHESVIRGPRAVTPRIAAPGSRTRSGAPIAG